MNAGRIIAYITAGILIFFGVLYIWAAFSPQGPDSGLLIGVITVAIGFGLIWLAGRSRTSSANNTQNVTLQVNLPGDVNLETLKCQSCGGALTPDNIKLVAGAPVVSCPYCKTTYQLTEEPKW